MNHEMNPNRTTHQRAARIYGGIARCYPAAHRRAFGDQMLQTFHDHYRDAVETGRTPLLWFWLEVAGDESRSLLREHLAALACALTEGMVPMKTVLPVVLAAVAALLLLALRVWLSPQLLNAPHGGGMAVSSVAGMAALVLIYAVAALGLFRILRTHQGAHPSIGVAARSVALWRAALLGASVGGVALVAITTDTLIGPESLVSLGVWVGASLAALLGWGVAAWLALRAGGSWRLGILAALWSGMVSALIAAVGEVASTLIALPRLVQHELSNPDYLYWHQPDVRSYAIASALALGMAGLILIPLAASLAGGVGSWLVAVAGRPAAREHPPAR